jgi:hypothetical protein
MANAYADLIVDQNVRYVSNWSLSDDLGNAIPLTSATITAQVRKFPGGDLVLDVSQYITITNAANGTLQIDIPSDILATLNAGKYLWDMLITYTNQTRYKVAGTFTVTGTITE